MSSKRTGLLSFVTLAAVLIAACQAPAAQAPAAPAATAEVINPPVIKETSAAEPTTAPEATAAPEATEAATTAPSAAAGATTFTVNGVTMPFNRNEAVIMDQVNYAVFDSFNPFIPNGLEFAAGWWQIANEYLWYANYA